MKQFSFTLKIFLLALAIRLFLLPFSYHSDLDNNLIWGIYAREFGLRGFYDWLNFGNYARPDYPPLAMIMFLWIRDIWQSLFNVFWYFNIHIKVFPSNFITWFDVFGSKFLIKVPGIFADLGIGYLIYKQTKKLKMAMLFLLNPAVIYLSASWGQLDSIVSFFALLSLILILKKHYFSSLFFIFISIMIKATFVPLIPLLILISYYKEMSFKKIIFLSLFLFVLLYLLGNIFIDKNPLIWIFNLYLTKIIKGAQTLPFINLNAFNFWAIILGMSRISDSVKFIGITYSTWAYAISSIILILIFYKFLKTKNIYFTALMIFFAIFMFFPRVHERYLYPVFVFFPLVLSKLPKLANKFYILSTIFFINLYHWWWFPFIPVLVKLFDFELVERGLSLINLILFTQIFILYFYDKKTASLNNNS